MIRPRVFVLSTLAACAIAGTTALCVSGYVQSVDPNQAPAIQANAYVQTDSEWGIVGDESIQVNGSNIQNWSPSGRTRLQTTGHAVVYGILKNVSMTSGDKFRLFNKGDWHESGNESINFQHLSFGLTSGYFTDAGESDDYNLVCAQTGTYDIYAAYYNTAQHLGIYAHDEAEIVPSYLYYCDGKDSNNWSCSCIYACGGIEHYDVFSKKKGMDMVTDSIYGSYAATSGLSLGGKFGNVRRVPYITYFGDTTFVLHNGNGYQTSDITFSSGSAYYYSGGNDGEGKALLTSDARLGEAAAFISVAEGYRTAVTASYGKHWAQSICGISRDNCITLVGLYDGLSPTAKGYVDKTKITTYAQMYNPTVENPTTTLVDYSSIMQVIRRLAA